MYRSRKHFHLLFESLESRALMAADFKVALYLETLDMNDRPVSKVEIGDMFKLRMSAEQLESASTPARGVGGYVGIAFDPKIADRNGDLVFADAYSISRNFQIKSPGQWNDVGAEPNATSTEFVTAQGRHVQWEVPMRANSGGEIVFQANPSIFAGIHVGSYYYKSADVSYGYARLQVGDSTQFPASPWRNPADPLDVDGNGIVAEEDLTLLETILHTRAQISSDSSESGDGNSWSGLNDAEIAALIALGSQSKIVLEGSVVPGSKAPFLDVNGDRVADSRDVAAVKERFLASHLDGAFQPMLTYVLDPSYGLELNVTNLRTGSKVQSDSEVLEGDLLQLELNVERVGLTSTFLSQLAPDPHFKLVQGRDDLIQVTAPGNLQLKYRPMPELTAWVAPLAGMTPDQLSNRLSELLDPLSRTLTVKENSQRPTATDLSYPYQQLVGLSTVRQVVQLLENPNALALRIDASQGVLKNVGEDEQVHAVVISNPSRGHLKVDDNGAFEYSARGSQFNSTLYDDLKEGAEFSYALISPLGVSEVRKVKIEGVALPLLDLTMTVVDAAGKQVSSLAVGQEAFLQVAAYSSDMYRLPYPDDPSSVPLNFDFGMASAVARSVGAPTTTKLFDWERISMGQENGQLVLKSDIVGAQLRTTEQETNVTFARYKLGVREAVLLRQKIVGVQPGELDLSITDAAIKFEGVGPGAVHVDVSSVQVTPNATDSDDRFDVSRNGTLSPLDALMVINRLNAPRALGERVESTTPTYDVCDVNRDGEVTPLDALLIVNRLSVRRNTPLPAEGESPTVANALAVDLAFADETMEAAIRKRQRR